MARPDLRARYQIAFRLKKTLREIDGMSVDEYVGWLAMFEMEMLDG